MKQNKIEINSNELTLFQIMLNNFGNELNIIKTNYNLLSKSKIIYISYYNYYLRISSKNFSSFRGKKRQ